MRIKALLAGTVLAATLVLAWALRQAPARADSYMYSVRQREIKVCILLLDSFCPILDLDGPDPTPGPDYHELENADPHIFYILDSRVDLKPRGWELVNPLAPRFVDQRIYDRWSRAPGTYGATDRGGLDPAHPYQIGQRVTKDMACYWEVYLNDVSLEELLQFDLIFLTSHMSEGPLYGPTATDVIFRPEDTRRLRQLVDMGGTIWVDDCWLMRIDPTAPFFIPEVNFRGKSLEGFGGKPRYGGIIADRHHPLLNSPYRLTQEEVNRLGDKNVDQYRITNLLGDGPPDPRLSPIVLNAGLNFDDPPNSVAAPLPYIAGGRYGGGRVLFTAGDVGCDINDWLQEPPAFRQTVLNPDRPDPNGGAYCGRDLWRAPSEDLKFAYNVLNWSQGESNYRKDPRRTGFTRDQVTPPLQPRWQVPLPPGFRVAAPPVMWRNMAFFTAENPDTTRCRIYAVDVFPQDDRDGDGDPNDGVVGLVDGAGNTIYDLTPGAPYDIVWQYPDPRLNQPELPGPASALQVATVTRNNQPVDVLFFTVQIGRTEGRLYALEAMPEESGTGRLLDRTGAFWPGLYLEIGPGFSSPIVNRGTIYTLTTDPVNNTYRLTCIDAATGGPPLPWQGDGPQPPLPWQVAGPQHIDLGNNATGEVDILPPVATALVRNEEKSSSDDVVYATLPTGRLAAMPIEIWGEMAELVPGDTNKHLCRVRYDWADPLADGAQAQYPGYLPSEAYRPTVRVFDANGSPTPWYYAPGDPNRTLDLANRDPANRKTLALMAHPGGTPFDITGTVPNARVAVDYRVDLQSYSAGSPRVMECSGYGTARFDANAPTALVLSGAAVGPDDTVYFATGNGMVYAVAERGGYGSPLADSANKVLWRYNLNTYEPDPTAGETNGVPNAYRRVQENSWVPAWVTAAWWQRPPENVWSPLPPAVGERMVYVAMNRYPNGPGVPGAVPIEGAVFAFDRGVRCYIELTQAEQEAMETFMRAHPSQTPALLQYDPEDADSEQRGWKSIPGNRANPRNNFWTYDRQRGRIVIHSFGPVLTICPSLPIYLDMDGNGSADDWDEDGTDVPRPFWLTVEANGVANRQGWAWGNLVWRYPSPEESVLGRAITGHTPNTPLANWTGGVASPPTLSGDVLYIGTGDGRLFALDADPRDSTLDPDRADPLDPLRNRIGIRDDGWRDFDEGFRVEEAMPDAFRNPQAYPADLKQPPLYPPDVLWVWPQPGPHPRPGVEVTGVSATSDLIGVAVNGANGVDLSLVYGMTRPVYAVGDASRMVKADQQGRVLWVMNEVIQRDQQYTGGAYGNTPAQVQKSLNRPQSATALSADTVLIADTGNDRVIATDQSGTVVWEASEIYDPLNILPAGEYRADQVGYNGAQMRVSRLSNPTDAVQWISYEQQTLPGNQVATIQVRHTLIADAGNYRVLEIVDKLRLGDSGYMPLDGATTIAQGQALWYHVVVWASCTNIGHREPADGLIGSGRWQPAQKYRYTQVQPIFLPAAAGEPAGSEAYTSRALVTIGNYALERVGRQRRQQAGASIALLQSPRRNPHPAELRADPTLAEYYWGYVVENPDGPPGYVSLIENPLDPAAPRKMNRPASLRRFRFTWQNNADVWHDLYADATGIYEWNVPFGDPVLPDGWLPIRDIDPNPQRERWAIRNDPNTMYSQFWPEQYQEVMAEWQGPNGLNVAQPFHASAFQFQPASVSRLPAGGWLITNRVLDRSLSNVLAQAGANDQARRIQIFTLRSDPVAGHPLAVPGLTGDYNPNDNVRFGFSQILGPQHLRESIELLFGPRLSDLGTDKDLGIDLVNPMYAVRTE